MTYSSILEVLTFGQKVGSGSYNNDKKYFSHRIVIIIGNIKRIYPGTNNYFKGLTKNQYKDHFVQIYFTIL